MFTRKYAISIFLSAITSLLVFQHSVVSQTGDEKEEDVLRRVATAGGLIEKDREGKVTGIEFHRSTDEQIVAIDFTVFSHMDLLSVRCPKITGRSLRHLRNLPPGLKMISVFDTPLDEREFVGLIQKQQSLSFLLINRAGLTDKTLPEFAKLSELRILLLDGENVSDRGVMNLSQLDKLLVLGLGRTKVTDKGLKHLRNLRNLIGLDLRYNEVSDAGIHEIKNLANLGSLDLSGSKVTDEGILALAQLEHLTFLCVRDTRVTEKGKRSLQMKLPSLKIDE